MSKNKNTLNHSLTHEVAPTAIGGVEAEPPKSFAGRLLDRARRMSTYVDLAAVDAYGRAREWAGDNKKGIAAIGLGVVAAGFASRFGIMPWLDNDTDTLASAANAHNSPVTVTFDDITPVNVSKPIHTSGNLPPTPLTSIEMGKFDTQTDPSTGYLNGTLWKEMAEEAQARGVHLSDEQLANLTGRALKNNGIDDATQLQIGQRLDISEDISREMGGFIGKPDSGALPPAGPGGGTLPGPQPDAPPDPALPPPRGDFPGVALSGRTPAGPLSDSMQRIPGVSIARDLAWNIPGVKLADKVAGEFYTGYGLADLSTRERAGAGFAFGIGLAALYGAQRRSNRTPGAQPNQARPNGRLDPQNPTEPNPIDPQSPPDPANRHTPPRPRPPQTGAADPSERQPNQSFRGGIESGMLPDWPRNRQDVYINPGYYRNWNQQQLEARRAHYEIYRDQLEEENDNSTEEIRRQLREQIDTLDRLLMNYGDQRLQASHEARITFANIPREAEAAAHQIYDDTVEYLRDRSYKIGDEIMNFHSERTAQEIGQERIRVMGELEELMQPESTSNVDPIKLVRKVAELDFVLQRLAMPDPRSTP